MFQRENIFIYFSYIFFFYILLFVCWFVCQEYYYGKSENNSMHGTTFYDDKGTRRSHIGCAKTIGCVIRVMLFVLLELNLLWVLFQCSLLRQYHSTQGIMHNGTVTVMINGKRNIPKPVFSCNKIIFGFN